MMGFYCIDNSSGFFVFSTKIYTNLNVGAFHLMIHRFSDIV